MLRNKTTGQVYLVVLFSLYLKEDINEDGSVKDGAAQRAAAAAPQGSKTDESHDEEAAFREAKEKLGEPHDSATTTSADDVD